MGKSLRVKDVANSRNENGTAIKIEDANTERRPKKGADLAIRAMIADAFTNRKVRLEEPKNDSVKRQAPPNPYIYLRVAIILIVLFVIVLSAFYLLKGYGLYPVLITILSVIVPFVVSIFFYEIDTSKRLSLYNILLIFSLVSACAMASELIEYLFIFDDEGNISTYGAVAIGLMECAIVFLLCTVFIYRLKIKDAITGMLIGAIIGAGFAVVNNINLCFALSFSETQYVPEIKALLFDETIITAFNRVVRESAMECLLHSLDRVLIGVIFAGAITRCRVNIYKEKIVYLLLFVVTVMGWLFASLWIMPFDRIGSLFQYILRAVITVAVLLSAGASLRYGLNQIEYY